MLEIVLTPLEHLRSHHSKTVIIWKKNVQTDTPTEIN